MTNPQPQATRSIGLNRRTGSMFGLQAAPADANAVAPDEAPSAAPAAVAVLAAAEPMASPEPKAPAASAVRSAPPIRKVAPAQQPMGEEAPIVRIGLYLTPTLSDTAQVAMASFSARNAAAIRRRGARRNSLNAFLAAVLDHALEHLDEIDPADLVRRMPTTGPKR